jgi:uncharacterized protein (DUF1778 family)
MSTQDRTDTKPQKSVGVFIRLTDEEKEAMQTAADEDERTLSDWMRIAARHKVRELGFLPMLEKKLPNKKES